MDKRVENPELDDTQNSDLFKFLSSLKKEQLLIELKKLQSNTAGDTEFNSGVPTANVNKAVSIIRSLLDEN